MKHFFLITLLVLLSFGVRAAEEELPQVPAADAKALAKVSELKAVVIKLAANTNTLSVDFSLSQSDLNDASLEALKPLSPQIVRLSLAGTKVTNAGLAHLSGLKNLRRLHLERTSVGDEGLAALKDLSELRYLNLYGTKVTDKGLATLGSLKNLKSVYLWQTPVTAAGAAELAKTLPGAEINRGEDLEAMAKKIADNAPKPINAKCPLTGKDLDPSKTFTFKGKLIGFCCGNCLGKFEKDPQGLISKVKEFKEDAKPAAAAKPAPAGGPIDDEGFIKHWLVLAPIKNEAEDAGAAEIDKLQIPAEGAVKPKAGEKIKAGASELAWKELKAADFFFDLREAVGADQGEDVLGYAVCYVKADAEMKGLKLLMGSNDHSKLYLNGKELLRHEGGRSIEKDQDTAENVTLNKGQNVIVFKVINEKNNWQGCVRFVDAAGKPVKNLKVSLVP